jgi:hypothetical protein
VLEPPADLWQRYDAALGIVGSMYRYEERLDLLAAVIWPTEERLLLREAA